MTLYVGRSGRRYESGSQIARGGEGTIFTIIGDPHHVLKIYRDEKIQNKESKILAMCKHPVSQSVDTQIMWPKDVVYDYGEFKGFVMNKISGHPEELNVLYEYGPSSKYQISWINKINVAINMCIVLDAVHSKGHVCGDFNPKNILVDTNTGFVTFVDTDSYCIVDGGITYRCPVGMSDYIAKEVFDKIGGKVNLENAPLPTYTQFSDNFALAVHIFQLLMNGCHPYQGAVSRFTQASIVNPSRVENIRMGAVPFINPSSSLIIIPSYAPSYESLPHYIRDLFKLAFIDGTSNPSVRPSPSTWIGALHRLKTELVQCSSNRLHQYYKGLGVCPFCIADQRFNNQPMVSMPAPFIKPPSVSGPKMPSIVSRPSEIGSIDDEDIKIEKKKKGFWRK